MFKGKRLSILGDSISTYQGISNDFSANRSTYRNEVFYELPFLSCNTYWSILMDELGLELCVNNSYSGALLSGEDDPTSGLSRASELSTNDGVDPDFIIVFMGINDFGHYIEACDFSRDYERTLAIIKEKYPLAYVCCVNMPRRSENPSIALKEYNQMIENAIKNAGERFFLADFFSSEMSGKAYFENTDDDLHPNENGMRLVADFMIKAFKENVK